MEIISLEFAFFVLAALVIYLLLPGKWQNLFLLAVSYYYYETWAWWYGVVLLALTLFNFFFARLLHARQANRRPLLWTGVGVNSALLLIFLLGSPISDQLNAWLSQGGQAGFVIAILLPLGFSYRALECISYLIDIYLKITKPAANFWDFALYLAYFPKLVSGPIERWRKFQPQLTERKIVDNQLAARSLMLILVGLARSVILGGMFTVLVPLGGILFEPQNYNGPQLIAGMIGFAFALYNQFAGYTDLVRGISGLFGIELTSNFAYPFFSKDFSDFWKRWHISLSSWLRDYVYMPFSRALLRRNPSRTNIPNLILPPLATMLVSGLWHGARLNLLVWGGLNGSFIVLENLLNLFRRAAPSQHTPAWRRALGTLVLFGLALGAAIPFRSSLPTTKIFVYQVLFDWKWVLPDLRMLYVIAASLLLDWLQWRGLSGKNVTAPSDDFIFLKWPRWAQASLATLVVFGVVIVYHLQNAATTFVYP